MKHTIRAIIFFVEFFFAMEQKNIQLLESGFSTIQQMYGQVNVTNAVNCFHSLHTQTDALPVLSVVYGLLKKYQNEDGGLDAVTKPGITDKWIEVMKTRYRDLPA